MYGDRRLMAKFMKNKHFFKYSDIFHARHLSAADSRDD